MRRIIAILFLSCLVVTTVGYHLTFSIQLYLWKSEVKKTLQQAHERKDVVRFSFNEEQLDALNWKEAHEFSWKGEWYDVLDQTKEDGLWVITCISDKKEKKLLTEYQKRKEQEGGSNRNVLLKLISTSFLLPDPVPLQNPSTVSTALYPHLLTILPSCPLDGPLQPPEEDGNPTFCYRTLI